MAAMQLVHPDAPHTRQASAPASCWPVAPPRASSVPSPNPDEEPDVTAEDFRENRLSIGAALCPFYPPVEHVTPPCWARGRDQESRSHGGSACSWRFKFLKVKGRFGGKGGGCVLGAFAGGVGKARWRSSGAESPSLGSRSWCGAPASLHPRTPVSPVWMKQSRPALQCWLWVTMPEICGVQEREATHSQVLRREISELQEQLARHAHSRSGGNGGGGSRRRPGAGQPGAEPEPGPGECPDRPVHVCTPVGCDLKRQENRISRNFHSRACGAVDRLPRARVWQPDYKGLPA